METNFKNLGEVFSHKKPFYEKIFHFIHRCHIFGEPNASLSPNFQQFGQMFMAKVDRTWQVTAKKCVAYFTNT